MGKLVDNPVNKRLSLSDVITLKACLYSSLTGGACYKVMLQSGNYDHVHELFGKMRRSGEVPKALTYRGNFFASFLSFITDIIWQLIDLIYILFHLLSVGDNFLEGR